jgi:hypothetical protein
MASAMYLVFPVLEKYNKQIRMAAISACFVYKIFDSQINVKNIHIKMVGKGYWRFVPILVRKT